MSSHYNTGLRPLLDQLQKDFPDINFVEADIFSWSPQDKTVCYAPKSENDIWSLLHETGHMLSLHSAYNSDIALLQMETEAWQTAKELAGTYGHNIDEEHIEQCIDSYRDWLHERSKCTVCAQAGLEQSSGQYKCINCGHQWKVGHDRFCRVYRKKTEPSVRKVLSAAKVYRT